MWLWSEYTYQKQGGHFLIDVPNRRRFITGRREFLEFKFYYQKWYVKLNMTQFVILSTVSHQLPSTGKKQKFKTPNAFSFLMNTHTHTHTHRMRLRDFLPNQLYRTSFELCFSSDCRKNCLFQAARVCVMTVCARGG
jgi:hypothetical protein